MGTESTKNHVRWSLEFEADSARAVDLKCPFFVIRFDFYHLMLQGLLHVQYRGGEKPKEGETSLAQQMVGLTKQKNPQSQARLG